MARQRDEPVVYVHFEADQESINPSEEFFFFSIQKGLPIQIEFSTPLVV